MDREEVRVHFIRQIGAAFAALAVALGVAVASGAPVATLVGAPVVALGLMLLLFWGVPSVIDVLAHWRDFRNGREHIGDVALPAPRLAVPPVPVTREIAVHGRGGSGVLTMVDFQDPHEHAWREALARLLYAAQSEGSLIVTVLEKYVDHREHVVMLTDVLQAAGLIAKAPGVETKLVPGMTYHAAIRRVTHLTSPLPLPAGKPPTVRTGPILDRSELVPTSREQREQYA